MRHIALAGVLAGALFPHAATAQPRAPQPQAPQPGRSVGPDVPVDVPASVYRNRREQLMKRLGPCAAALRAAPASGDDTGVADPYFFYLTGLNEPGALLLLSPRQLDRHILLLPPLDPDAEVWTGYRDPLSPALRRKLAVDVVRRTGGNDARHLGRALRRSRCYAHLRPGFARQHAFDPAVLGTYLSSYEARAEQRWEALEAMRTIKDADEILRIEKAVAITIEGHRAAARSLREGVTERLVASRIEDAFFAAGATGVAFPSIVASGPAGAVLHWTRRDREVAQSDLVVVDIGASYGGYAADVTRTYPVSGVFDAEQRKVYDAVLMAQERVFEAIRPGVSLARLHKIAEAVINEAGYDLPHTVGHFVGLEVHDVGDPDAPLEAGMVITVEPGIYIKDRFGVRIEDMVLVTPRGHRLLTADLPRAAADVEAWIKSARAP